jgi:hypothetical protein
VGCPGPTKNAKPTDGTAAADSKAATDKGKDKAGDVVEIAAETDGTVKGVVKFKGTPPEPKPLKAIEAHKNAKECLAGGAVNPINVIDQEWIISKDGKVANVVISLTPPAGKKFKITEALKKPFEQTVVMDQPFCQYIPHVAAVYAGVQPFAVKNSSDLGHNVKIVGTKNTPSDDNPNKGETTLARKYAKESGPINISCSVHNWMTAKLWAFDHPYFAVTKDDGSFEIKNVPVGEELTVWLWHESKGGKAVEVQKLTLKKGDNPLDLEIGAGK